MFGIKLVCLGLHNQSSTYWQAAEVEMTNDRQQKVSVETE